MTKKVFLYIRFDVNAITTTTTGNYERACYELIFKNVQAYLLDDCLVYIGTNMITENESVCTIGLAAPIGKLEAIRQELAECDEFRSVSAKDALVLVEEGTESLEYNGMITEDGRSLKYQASIAYYTIMHKNMLRRDKQAPQRHGCLTTWLILVVVLNVGMALFLASLNNVDSAQKIGFIIGAIVSVVGAIFIWNWKIIGFLIFAVFAALALIFNLIGGNFIGVFQSIAPIAVLYGVLKIEKEGVSGWDNLK